ncbi:hypothetical protein TNIN_223181 [Trichonephila inaurata madagascariensis]|uniref:Uncharacterized protein n=1 Tax=Trichonephila inaurata madagascariensis TaxID=2747483 RepID=A0A8X6X263_9ARAC|nr:hypothetical protein TNIN_223181 [Trichonephila inaurata madagascariensis]
MGEIVLPRFDNSSSKSSRAVGVELNALQMGFWSVLHTVKMYLFHIQKVQFLTEDDYLITHFKQPQFPDPTLFTDEANFIRKVILNIHNIHGWERWIISMPVY